MDKKENSKPLDQSQDINLKSQLTLMINSKELVEKKKLIGRISIFLSLALCSFGFIVKDRVWLMGKWNT